MELRADAPAFVPSWLQTAPVPQPEPQVEVPMPMREHLASRATPEPRGLADMAIEKELLVHICSFLDRPKDLGRLACATSAFGRKTAWERSMVDGGAEQRSVVEESARRWAQQVVDDGGAGRGERQSWLRQMQDMRGWVHGLSAATAERWASLGLAGMASAVPFRPLVFTAHSEGIGLPHCHRGAVAENTRMEFHSAVCGGALMTEGRHFVEVTPPYGHLGRGWMVGVVGEGFDPAVTRPRMSRYDDEYDDEYESTYMLEFDGELLAGDHDQAWMYSSKGDLWHAGNVSKWEGMRRAEEDKPVGLLLDLNVGSLAIYINGERLGLMVAEGIEGPVRWAVDLANYEEVGGRGDGFATALLGSLPAPIGDFFKVRELTLTVFAISVVTIRSHLCAPSAGILSVEGSGRSSGGDPRRRCGDTRASIIWRLRVAQ
jgi:hypothetical protein